MRWRSVGSAAIVKAVTLPLNALIALFSMQLIIGRWGVEAYASYGLLIALVALMPFADLGMAAVVVNTVSKSGPGSRALRRALLSVIRILICSGLAIAVCAVLITFTLGWRPLLGDSLFGGTAGDFAVMICVVLFGLNLPLSVGARALLGLGQNTTLVLIQTLQYPLILIGICIMLMVSVEAAAPYLAVSAYVATIVVNSICLIRAKRSIGSDLSWALRRVARFRVRGARVGHAAWPMLIQSVAVPLATQSDRVIISQVSSGEQLAQYNLASQVFMMVWQITAAAGVSLWPMFARMRQSGLQPPIGRVALIFGTCAASGAGLLVLFVPLIEQYVGHGLIVLDPLLVASFVMYVTLNGLMYPLGMSLMDPAGLRFQAWCVSIALPINLIVSFLLCASVGAAGPIIASALSLLVFQITPYLWRYRTERTRNGDD